MKFLSELDEVKIGQKVLSVLDKTGTVTDIWVDDRYSPNDSEKNPWIKIIWEGGHHSHKDSIQPKMFMDKVRVVE